MTTFQKPRNLAFSFSQLFDGSDVPLEGNEIDKLWEDYWIKYGESIVHETWNILYSDYIAYEDSEIVVSEHKELEPGLDTHYAKQEATADHLQDASPQLETSYAEDWEKLWEDHWAQQQFYVYSLFKENYNTEFDPRLVEITLEQEFLKKLGLPTAFKTKCENRSYHTTENIIEELNPDEKNLKSLGLPTSFVGTNSRGSNFEETYYIESEEEMADETKNIQTGRVQKKKNKNKKKYNRNQNLPDYIERNQSLLRYWKKRFSLFSRFDEGIQLDEESWYSVTPENVASQLADRIKCDTIVDAFCGCGGNSIQFAKSGKRVIAIDIDEEKILKAKHNAKIYKVSENIEFIVGDFLKLCEDLRGVDAIFLSPPWGGVDYKKCLEYDIESQLQPIGAGDLLTKCRTVTENIAIFLPRNSSTTQIVKLAGAGRQVEIEKNFLDRRFVGITAFFGGLIKNNS